NAIIHKGKIVGVSILTIKSSVGEGFKIEGKTFRVENQSTIIFDVTDIKSHHGWFTGKEGYLFAQDGIAYTFSGQQFDEHRQGSPNFGVVYYQFFKGDPILPGLMWLKGAFLAREVNFVYHVIGRRIEDPQECELPERDVHALANAWINNEIVREF